MIVQLFTDKEGGFRYRLKGDNGEVMVTSESYTRQVDAKRGLDDLLRNTRTLPPDAVSIESLYREHEAREWTDSEPDTLTIRVCEAADDGKPAIVFTCSATWLDAITVRDEVIPWLNQCVRTAFAIKAVQEDSR